MTKIIPSITDNGNKCIWGDPTCYKKKIDWLKKYSSLCNLQATQLLKIKNKRANIHHINKAKNRTKCSFTFYGISVQSIMKTKGLQLTIS